MTTPTDLTLDLAGALEAMRKLSRHADAGIPDEALADYTLTITELGRIWRNILRRPIREKDEAATVDFADGAKPSIIEGDHSVLVPTTKYTYTVNIGRVLSDLHAGLGYPNSANGILTALRFAVRHGAITIGAKAAKVGDLLKLADVTPITVTYSVADELIDDTAENKNGGPAHIGKTPDKVTYRAEERAPDPDAEEAGR